MIGLLLLTPVFTADLRDEQVAAQRAGSARLLDARLSPGLKLRLAGALAARIDGSDGRPPDLAPAFREIVPPPAARRAYARLEADLGDEVQRAATHAFSRSFLLAAALALLALAPIALAGRSLAWGLPLVGALALAAAVVGPYLALGGSSYKPLAVRDPCQPRSWRNPHGLQAVVEQISLSALDGAACRLRVTREELALAVASPAGRSRFLRQHRIRDPVLADALRSGLRQAVTDARRAGALSGAQASLAQSAVDAVPIATVIDVIRGGRPALDALLGGSGVLGLLRRVIGG